MPPAPPSLRLILGDIVTMDPERPRAEAMAVAGDRILAIGDVSEVRATLPSGAPEHRPQGTIVPGLVDSHFHLQWAGLKLLRLLDSPQSAASMTAAELEAVVEADGMNEPWPDGEPTIEQRAAAMRLVQPMAFGLGLTGVVDPAATAGDIAGYVESHRRGELTLRIVAMPHLDVSRGVEPAIAALSGIGASTGLGDDTLALGGVKIYFDGEGMHRTALRREPWPGKEDEPDPAGWQRLPDEDFLALARFCAQNGWAVGVHVVGGGGIDRVLDLFAQIDATTPLAGRGFTLIHAYLEPSAENMATAARLGVLVTAQPAIHWNNGAGLVRAVGEHAVASNPIRGWLDAGVVVGGGSDGPSFPFDPRLGLWQSRTRIVRGEEAPHAPELAIDAHEALAMYTTGSAAASWTDRRGALRPGMLADWVALSADPSTDEPEVVRSMTVHETAVGGEIVFTA